LEEPAGKIRVQEVGEAIAVEDQRRVAIEDRADRAVEDHPVGAEGIVVDPDLARIWNGREQIQPDVKRHHEAGISTTAGGRSASPLLGNCLRLVPSPCVVLPSDELLCCGRMRIGADLTTIATM
jgi:hypothetical protein